MGYTNLFCIPELTSVFFSCCDSVLGYSHSSIREIEVLTSLIGNMELLNTKCRGIAPDLAAREKSHELFRVVAGTWCIFSSYGGDGHLKLGFVQRSQDSCLVMTDSTGS